MGHGADEAFSDGVLAIAITLLVLDIRIPRSDFEDLWQGIADQWPTYLLVISSLPAAMWRAVAKRPQLLPPDLDDEQVETILRAAAPSIGLYVLAMLVAIAAPRLAAFGLPADRLRRRCAPTAATAGGSLTASQSV